MATQRKNPKVSKHGQMRMKQRTQLNHRERATMLREALNKGQTPQQVEDELLRGYLLSKVRFNSKVKLYKGYVFIYSRNSHRLYTMYELPEWIKEKRLENEGST